MGALGAFNLRDGDQEQYNMILSLLDVELVVESGSTPFNASSVTGLLRLDASSKDQSTNIIPNVPYMYMAPETCATIAQHLPVVLSTYTNLYIWDTTDPQFERIIQSPSYLAFVFGTSGVGNLTIKVPFQLLNLTLSAPIVSPAQQFFPCQPFHASDGSGHYVLGKAFLQAAFLGMNWQQNKFFVAQAPGPRPAGVNLQTINPTDEMIKSNPIFEFSSSWEQHWTPIAASSSNNGSEAADTALAWTPSRGSGLSTGAKVGIALGVVVGVLALAFAVVLCIRRQKDGSQRSGESFAWKSTVPREEDGQWFSNEVGGHGLSHEDGQSVAHEIGGHGCPMRWEPRGNYTRWMLANSDLFQSINQYIATS
ncbi:MAG: hypothetical protein Q9226_007029 [Calogaya cf. arnoldii]